MRTHRWGKAVLAVAALGGLLTFSATGFAGEPAKPAPSCKENGEFAKTLRTAKGRVTKPAPCPKIEVTKTADKDTYQPGESIKWTVTIKNTGKDAVAIKVEDKQVALRRAGGKWCGGILKPGSTLTCVGQEKTKKCGTVSNTVKVTATAVTKDGRYDKGKKKPKHPKPPSVVVSASDSAFVFCDPKVSKDAKVSYVKTWDWTIDKSADKTVIESTDAEVTVSYVVKVTKSDAPVVSNVKVAGTISVNNPYPFAIDVKVTDKLTSNEPCKVEGVDEKSATIGPGTATFAYSCDLAAVPAAGVKNRATATFKVNGVDGTATGEAAIQAGKVTEVDDTVKVTDLVWKLGTPDTVFVPEELLGTTNVTKEFKYTRTFPVPATNCVEYKNIATVSSPGKSTPSTPVAQPEGSQNGGTTTSTKTNTTTTDTTKTDTTKTDTTKTDTTTTGTTTTGTTTTGTTTTTPNEPPKTSTLPKSDDWTVKICRKIQDLAVTKTATTKITNDWTIDKSSKSGTTFSPAADPQPITYGVVLTKTSTYAVSGKVTVQNPNSFGVAGVNVTDSIGNTACTVTGGAIGALAAGATAEATYTCTITSSADGTNQAKVDWIDPALDPHTQMASANYTFNPANEVLRDKVDITDVFDGQPATAPASGVASSGPIGDYTRNAATASMTPGTCRDVVNTATLRATDDPSYTKNDSVTVSVCKPAVTPPPPPPPPPGSLGTVSGVTGGPTVNRAALAVSKTGPGAATAGQLVTYRIKVTNRSRIAARGVVLRDLLPSGFSVPGKVKGASVSSGRVNWSVGALAPGASRTVSVQLRIDRSVAGRRCNQAVATAGNANTVRDSQCTRIAGVAGALQPAVTG